MIPKETIEAIFTDVRSQLPAEIEKHLKFPEPKTLNKKEFLRWLGRVYGKQAGKIWDVNWALYQIFVGSPPDRPEIVGGVQFGFSPKNQNCGGGRHEAAVYEIAARFCASRPRFRLGERGGTWFWFGINYHRGAVPSIPLEQATRDMVELITATYPALDALAV